MDGRPAEGIISALELACGTGASCVYIAETMGGTTDQTGNDNGSSGLRGRRVVGVDLVHEAVVRARQAAAKAGVQEGRKFLQADVFTLLGPTAATTMTMASTTSRRQDDGSVPSPLSPEEGAGGRAPSTISHLWSPMTAWRMALNQEAVSQGAQVVAAVSPQEVQESDDGDDDPSGFDFIYDCQVLISSHSVHIRPSALNCP